MEHMVSPVNGYRRCDGKAIPMKEALRALLMLVLGAIFILGIGIFG
jgi:hypothetical protein